ncbi:Protein translocase subunit SecE [BD1-7 clade bacterium]|uniref:Protein translocase subunit SecE n=1 Tax=BD1-7 clade bacterium TaxID=2029982 RepID=A0A5S9MRZ8_9GAMM|nr:Protein translocase subunit SecE [BD1-7 clade bacterium]
MPSERGIDTYMSTSGQETASSSMDVFKWVVVVAFVAVGVFGNFYFADEYSPLYRALALVPMAGVALVVALQTARGAAFARLVKESRAEIRRVVWPSKQETTQTTLIVFAVVVVMGLVLWLLDMGLNWLISLFIG